MHTSAVTFSLHYVTLTVVTKPRIIQGPSQAAIASKPLSRVKTIEQKLL